MQWVAHRGLQAKFPENTVLACQQAYAAGIKKIEVDVQFSQDGIAMLYHDLSLHRVSEHSGLISQYKACELEHISAFEPQRFDQKFVDNTIEPLSALIDWATPLEDLYLYIEFKEESLAHISREYALDHIKKQCHPMLQRCIFISFDLEFIQQAQADLQLKTGLVISNWEQTEEHKDWLAKMDCVFCNYLKINIQTLPAKKDHWILYEITDLSHAKQWQQLGFEQFESFEAARFHQYTNE